MYSEKEKLKNEINSILDGEGKSLFVNSYTFLTLCYYRRSCPGTYLAEVEMFLALVQILARCSIEPPKEGMPNIEDARNVGLNVVPPPCKFRFVKRHDSLV